MNNIKPKSLPSFNDIINFFDNLPDVDQNSIDNVRLRDKDLLKPKKSLGRLEDLVEWCSGWQARYPPSAENNMVAIFASTHGVTANSISPYPSSVTEEMVNSFKSGYAAINQICKIHDTGLQVFDLAIEIPTGDISKEDAMSEKDCISAILYGREAISSAPDVLCLGEMGIGNTTVASCICAALYGGDVSDWVGSGTGADKQMMERKVQVIEKALKLHKNRDPLEILRCMGGREFSAIFGAIMASRFERIPVILDGFPVCAAAAVMHEISPGSLDHCIVGHLSDEKGHRRLLKNIGKKPILDLNMKLGEASGAAISLQILITALNIHNHMATFDEAKVSNKS
jgi:nicotinate-nucleotide--dimethylbenzimidazole phosphoribosyltransferase